MAAKQPPASQPASHPGAARSSPGAAPGAAQEHPEQPGGARHRPEQPGAAQEHPGTPKSSHVQPAAAQEQEGAARGCPGAAGRSSEQSGGTRSSQSSQPATSILNPSASHQPANQLARSQPGAALGFCRQAAFPIRPTRTPNSTHCNKYARQLEFLVWPVSRNLGVNPNEKCFGRYPGQAASGWEEFVGIVGARRGHTWTLVFQTFSEKCPHPPILF